jgi:hypothetical protein
MRAHPAEEVDMVAVQLAVAATASVIGDCDLCATGPVALGEAVVIAHVEGSSVSFSACDRCGRAMRRVAAAIGGDAETITTTTVTTVTPATPRTRVMSMPPVFIHEFIDHIIDVDGTHYVVQAYGQPRTDGTWIGWLKFAAVGAATILRTSTETTQPDRGALAYWASGLERTYLEGAFARAQRRRRVRAVG